MNNIEENNKSSNDLPIKLSEQIVNIPPNVKSNVQFQYIFNFGTEKTNKILYEMINKPFPKNLQKLGKELFAKIKTIQNDDEIYLFIHNFLNENIYKKNPPNNESEGRANSRSVEIEKLFNSVANSQFNIDIYLDIGCSKGSITNSVINTLHPTRTIGFDVIDIENSQKLNFEYVKMNANIDFNDNNNGKSKTKYKPFVFELENKTVQFATFNVSMHHIPPIILQNYLKELNRVMIRGGIVIIREHDIDNNKNKSMMQKKILVDILHGLYSISWNLTGQMEDENFIQNYYANYNSKNYWSNLFRLNGFSRVINKTTSDYYHMGEIADLQNLNNGKIRNPFNLYWAVYRKN